MSLSREKYRELTDVWDKMPKLKTKELVNGVILRYYDEREIEDWVYGKLEAWLVKQFHSIPMIYDDGFAVGVG